MISRKCEKKHRHSVLPFVYQYMYLKITYSDMQDADRQRGVPVHEVLHPRPPNTEHCSWGGTGEDGPCFR